MSGCQPPMAKGRVRHPANGSAALLATLAGLVALMPACAYRFTNEHIKRPQGIKTIAVEAVYDTSREVLPHEILWKSLQDAIARDGNLRLAPASSADAILRAHIRSAEITPRGERIQNSPEDDPNVFNRSLPEKPSKFKILTQAEEVRDAAALRLGVHVEVVHLRTRSRLMSETYSLGGRFRAVHADKRGTVTTRSNDFLRYEEGVETTFAQLSESISRRVVRDLLIR